jgi:hypothetical protein
MEPPIPQIVEKIDHFSMYALIYDWSSGKSSLFSLCCMTFSIPFLIRAKVASRQRMAVKSMTWPCCDAYSKALEQKVKSSSPESKRGLIASTHWFLIALF